MDHHFVNHKNNYADFTKNYICVVFLKKTHSGINLWYQLVVLKGNILFYIYIFPYGNQNNLSNCACKQYITSFLIKTACQVSSALFFFFL